MVRKSSAVMSMQIFSLTSSAKSISQALAWQTTSRSRGFSKPDERKLYNIISQSLGIRPSGEPYAGFRDAVDGALNLARAGGDGGQRVSNGQAQVVMAMRGEDDAFGVDGRDALADFSEHAAVFFGGGVADGVRHVDGGGAGLDGHANHLDEEIAIGAGGILGGELDIVHQRAGKAHRFGG